MLRFLILPSSSPFSFLLYTWQAPLLLLPLPLLLNKRLVCEGGQVVQAGENCEQEGLLQVVQTGDDCEEDGVLQTGQEWSAAYVVLLMGVYWWVEGGGVRTFTNNLFHLKITQYDT